MSEPGCFSAPSVFTFNSSVCGSCRHFSACQSGAHAKLLAAPVELVSRLLDQHNRFAHERGIKVPGAAKLDITIPTLKAQRDRRVYRIPPSERQLEDIEKMPKKAGNYLRKMIVRGFDQEVIQAARVGENAFSLDKHRPYHLALQTLLEKGSVTKGVLRTAYCEDLGWSEGAAFSQVSIVWSLFPALGIATAQGCSLSLDPNVRCDNTTC